MPEMKFRVQRLSSTGRPVSGWQGVVSLPFVPGAMVPTAIAPGGAPDVSADGKRLAVTATGPSKSSAAKKAAGAALKVLSNPAVQAVMPPQAKLALTAIKKVPWGRIKKLF